MNAARNFLRYGEARRNRDLGVPNARGDRVIPRDLPSYCRNRFAVYAGPAPGAPPEF